MPHCNNEPFQTLQSENKVEQYHHELCEHHSQTVLQLGIVCLITAVEWVMYGGRFQKFCLALKAPPNPSKSFKP
jgi:hypothetical protein